MQEKKLCQVKADSLVEEINPHQNVKMLWEENHTDYGAKNLCLPWCKVSLCFKKIDSCLSVGFLQCVSIYKNPNPKIVLERVRKNDKESETIYLN